MGEPSQTPDLLPDSLDDFRDVGFWDRFFKARKQVPFEWYGDWKQIKVLVEAACPKSSRVLVPGCGNSDLSSAM